MLFDLNWFARFLPKFNLSTMSSEQPTMAGDLEQKFAELAIQATAATEKLSVASLSEAAPAEQPIRSYVDIVSEMIKETKMGKVTDMLSLVELAAPGYPDGQASTKDEQEPKWFE